VGTRLSLAIRLFGVLVFGSQTALEQSESQHVLRGHVIEDINEQGLAQARVVLAGSGLASPRAVVTNGQGEFAFPNLPEGSYHLTVEKAGYFPRQYGDPIQISARAETDLGDILCMAKRSIAGTLLWKDGEPAVEAIVQASLITGSIAGPKMTRPVANASTDEQGNFRIAELHPGRYVMLAYSRAVLTPDSKPRIGLPVFYPGSTAPNLSAGVDTRYSSEMTGISITLEERDGLTIEGSIQPTPSCPAGSDVLVGLMIEGVPSLFFINTHAHSGGMFRLDGVPPGNYLLVGSYPDKPNGWQRNIQSITVRDKPLHDLMITLRPAPLTGRVELEIPEAEARNKPTAAAVQPAPNVRIIVDSDKLGPAGFSYVSTDAEGAFRAGNTAPGEQFTLTFPSLPRAYIFKVTQGVRDLSNGPFTVTAGAEPIRVMLRKDCAKVETTVRSGDRPANRAFVVVVPKDHKLLHRYVTGTTDANGVIRFENIAPGDYDVFALDRNIDDQYLIDTYLRQWANHSVPLSVVANGVDSLRLDLIMTKSGK
jgi:hypothetical protein